MPMGREEQVSTASREGSMLRAVPWPPRIMMLAGALALGLAILAVPFLGLGSLVIVALAVCGVMLLVIFGWAQKGRVAEVQPSHPRWAPETLENEGRR